MGAIKPDKVRTVKAARQAHDRRTKDMESEEIFELALKLKVKQETVQKIWDDTEPGA